MCEIARVMGERETAAKAEERITRASGIYLEHDTAKQTDQVPEGLTLPPDEACVEETST